MPPARLKPIYSDNARSKYLEFCSDNACGCPREEHRARLGYVRDDDIESGGAEFLIHKQKREPYGAATVVDTSQAMAGVSETIQIGGAKSAHGPSLSQHLGT